MEINCSQDSTHGLLINYSTLKPKQNTEKKTRLETHEHHLFGTVPTKNIPTHHSSMEKMFSAKKVQFPSNCIISFTIDFKGKTVDVTADSNPNN